MRWGVRRTSKNVPDNYVTRERIGGREGEKRGGGRRGRRRRRGRRGEGEEGEGRGGKEGGKEGGRGGGGCVFHKFLWGE